MLFTKPFKEAIVRGEVTTTFRTWRTPKARNGGEYNIPPYGAIRVDSVQQTTVAKAPARAVRAAGFKDKQSLTEFLKADENDPVYLVSFEYLGDKPVKVPDRARLTRDELDALAARLRKMSWAHDALNLIKMHPQTRAGDLAPEMGMELQAFKGKVRRLKALGLTISHDVGYELSERGLQALKRLDED